MILLPFSDCSAAVYIWRHVHSGPDPDSSPVCNNDWGFMEFCTHKNLGFITLKFHKLTTKTGLAKGKRRERLCDQCTSKQVEAEIHFFYIAHIIIKKGRNSLKIFSPTSKVWVTPKLSIILAEGPITPQTAKHVATCHKMMDMEQTLHQIFIFEKCVIYC